MSTTAKSGLSSWRYALEPGNTGNLGHEDLAALHGGETAEDEVDTQGQGDPEARHPFVGDQELAGRRTAKEEAERRSSQVHFIT